MRGEQRSASSLRSEMVHHLCECIINIHTYRHDEIRIIVRGGHSLYRMCYRCAVESRGTSTQLIQYAQRILYNIRERLRTGNDTCKIAIDENILTAVALRRIVAVSANSTKNVLCPDNILYIHKRKTS